MTEPPILVWLRDDLRLADNPALDAALARRRPLVLLWLLDEVSPGIRPLGGAARWWLHHSLSAFARSVEALGGRLVLRRGPAAVVVPAVVEEIGADTVLWNRRWGGGEVAVDRELKSWFAGRSVRVESFRAALLHEPATLRTGAGTPFRVFTPFWKACLATGTPRPPLPAPTALPAWNGAIASDRLADWRLLPTAPDWAGGIAATWTPGEAAAADRLDAFLDEGIYSYDCDRDRPDRTATSRLSPHLRFGEISPFQIVAALAARAERADPPPPAACDKFLAELGWREFSHHQRFHAPDIADHNRHRRFDAFPWRDEPATLAAWSRGETGYPLVDAGMRELWTTGTMHNRVRMVVASFLVKHLLIDWRAGERWFWDTLVDACPAANPASWQWVAGCGADAAPYFRIFNPVTQGTKFDPDGTYVRRWLPELARLPAAVIHAPWTASRSVLDAAGLRLGRDRPLPIVDHTLARTRALAALATLGTGD